MPDYHRPHKLKATFTERRPRRKRCALSTGKLLAILEAEKPLLVDQARRFCRLWLGWIPVPLSAK